MTRATRKNTKLFNEETSFISIFRKLGFKTTWISEQVKIGHFDTSVAAISSEAEEEIFQNNNLTLEPYKFKNYLIDTIKKPSQQLAIFHMLGSHFPYQWMYPEEFKKYVPTCSYNQTKISDCDQESFINSYDNTIIFTDYFLKNVIDAMRDKNALVIYVSDHGEYLGERGMYLHGQETEDAELRHVPMIWWASDKFIKLHHDKIANMRSHLNDHLSHDNVFHSVLDCAGIESPVIDKSLSICNSK